MIKFMHKLFAGSISKPISRKPAYRPGVEGLEDRKLMTVTVGLDPADLSILRITSNNASDIVRVVQNDDTDVVQVFSGNSNTPLGTFTSSSVDTVAVNLNGGNDSFSYRLAAGSDFENAKRIQINGGLGNDSISLDFNDNGNAEIDADLSISIVDVRTGDLALLPSSIPASIVASQAAAAGRDRVDAVFGRIDNSHLAVFAALGIDNDTMNFELRDNLQQNASAFFFLQGDQDRVFQSTHPSSPGQPVLLRDGGDIMDVRATNDVDALDSDARLQVTMIGGSGGDLQQFRYDGEMDGQLILTSAGVDGNDRLIAEIALDQGSSGELNAVLDGNNGNDLITFRLIDDAASDFIFQNRRVRGGNGSDAAFITSNIDLEAVEAVYAL